MDVWKHGRYVDLWSLVHLLSGVALALMCYGLGYDFWSAAILSIALLIAWESFEWMIGIIEPSPNVGVDLAVGVLGFILGTCWHYLLGNAFNLLAFSAILLITIGLSLWGFLDFRSRGYR